MNKQIGLIFFIIAAFAGGIFYFVQKNRTPFLEKARQFERAGNLQMALSLYTETVFNLSPSMQVPDNYRSKFLTPDALKKEVMKYISWLSSPSTSRRTHLTDALSGIQRCMQYGRKDVTLAALKSDLFTQDSYLTAWNTSFFAPGAKIDPTHSALAAGNLAHNLSLVLISCGKYYTYDVMLVNKSTLHATRCTLPAENSVRLYALPGEHLLIVRSTATFSSGEIWVSHFTPQLLLIPEKASEIQLELRTRVARR